MICGEFNGNRRFENNRSELCVSIAHGRPVDDADVFMIADHTEMRGMTMTGPATAQGNGRYAITADFVHGGTWRVTIQINQDGTNVALEDFDLAVRQVLERWPKQKMCVACVQLRFCQPDHLRNALPKGS
ncbi:MAG: FixH family protein [Anaerolinea sp.]|nr:FixH family protein [Anaerolinea sp.]